MKYLGRGAEFREEALREIQHDVLERHRAAQINVIFDPKANQTRRRGALKLIADSLRITPGGFKGAVLADIPEGLESAGRSVLCPRFG